MAVAHVANGGRVAYYAAPQREAKWPHQVGVIPREAACFRDRTATVQLDQALGGQDRGARRGVLTGLGGVGKTQLAAYYARELWQSGRLDLLVWTSATSRSTIVSAYAQAGSEVLGLDPVTSEEQAARAFLAWLEPKHGAVQPRWMVVLDDLAEPSTLRDLWPPASPRGFTLVTTRRRDAALAGGDQRMVPIGLFTPLEAQDYLASALSVHDRCEDLDQLASLAAELGHLPLALSQAVAFLLDTKLDCAAYRVMLGDRTRPLSRVLPESSALPDDQPAPATAAFTLSVERADELTPAGLASRMLELSSILDANGVPASVLESPHTLAYLTAHGPGMPEQARAEDVRQALRNLHRLSLIDQAPDNANQVLRVHPLVQRAVLDGLAHDRRDALARVAADALANVWPADNRDATHVRAMCANADALLRHAEDALHQHSAHPVLFRCGEALGAVGQVAAAVDRFQKLVNTTHRHLGPEHSDSLLARQHLARWRGETGDAAGSAELFAELLADRERIQGPDHLDTLATRAHLARWRGAAGDEKGAARIAAELISDSKRVLGSEHRLTLIARNNHAWFLGNAGDAAGAAAAFGELHTARLRILGPDHPDTLAARSNLGYFTEKAGDVASATSIYADLLADFERIFGPDDPETLFMRQRVAFNRGAAGDMAAAIAAYADLRIDTERVLGADHPYTLSTRANSIAWRRRAGDSSDAIPAYVELIADCERILGPDHPDTLAVRSHLAQCRGEMGDAVGAASADIELIADCERILGPDHPDTLACRRDLVSRLCQAEEYVNAISICIEELADCERRLGPDHPDTLQAREHLALWQSEVSAADGASTPLHELLADSERLLGDNHPATLRIRYMLACWRGSTGDSAGAARMLADLLTDAERALGSDHALTVHSRKCLGFWRERASLA